MSPLLREGCGWYESAKVDRPTAERCSIGSRLKTHQNAADSKRETLARLDEELAVLAQAGDTQAFGELVQRHFAACLKKALLMLRNHDDAEDEVQNAFAKAFESLHQFRFEGTFSAWLCRIMQNQCLMRLRERGQTEVFSVDATPDSSARMEFVNQADSPEDELGAREVNNLLHTQMARIPPLMRTAILLRDVEDLPIGEVAKRLGVSVPAAKSRLTRARKEMRSRLKERCGRNAQQTLTSRAAYAPAEYIGLG